MKTKYTYIFLRLDVIIAFIIILLFTACEKVETKHLSEKQKALIRTIPKISLIAHRGSCVWAPENTEAAMRWARNAGADYLECDLQRTADGYLVLYHDKTLSTKSNVHILYPHLQAPQIKDFTLEELFQLDFGSWFNQKHKQYARTSFSGLEILTLEDLIKIAEGNKIKRDQHNKRIYRKSGNKIITEYEKDPHDNGNRPGIYPEIKYPDIYPSIENDLKSELERLEWFAYDKSKLKYIHTKQRHVGTANTQARVIVQTFSTSTLQKLNEVFSGEIPTCLLLSASGQVDSKTYKNWINNAINNNASIIAPSISSDKPYNFTDLLQPWMYDLIKESGLLIHAYVFQNEKQISNYKDLADGYFCDQIDIAIKYFLKNQQIISNTVTKNGAEWLNEIGY